MGEISDRHPLRTLLADKIAKHFGREVGLRDEDNLGLSRQPAHRILRHPQSLCAQKCARPLARRRGRHACSKSDPIFGTQAQSFDRERQVRKHIGDFTLFYSGMFPEAINRFRLRRQRLESLIDFVHAGKESYFIVSQFDQMEYRKVAPLFGRLSQEFETCVFGLNLVRQDLTEMQYALVRPTDFVM